MERTMARSFACLAINGKCSLILMPETAVSIGLNGPALAWPVFRSKVSVCVGPPLIHRRMQLRLRWGFLAASAARVGRNEHKPALEAMKDLRLSIAHLLECQQPF